MKHWCGCFFSGAIPELISAIAGDSIHDISDDEFNNMKFYDGMEHFIDGKLSLVFFKGKWVPINKEVEIKIVMKDEESELTEKLVAVKLTSTKSRFPFDGFNCGSVGRDCDGWDGISRRCECGNRRVSWVLSDDKKFVYGEAF